MTEEEKFDKEWKEGFLTTDYIMKQHPEITKEEASDLLEFSKSNTIDRKQCYDKGQIMYPMWQEFNKQTKK